MIRTTLKKWPAVSIGLSLLCLSGCAVQGGAALATRPPALATAASKEQPPPAPREFRAAWVASVANIDWPSRRDLTVAQQQAEIVALLDRAQELRLNAIVLQVRPSADALYPSTLEPWSEYLTGEQGKAPEPFYDPLQMWVEEAHRRGIELHAWFNPYRARHLQAKSPPAPNHISRTHPELVRQYGNYLWIDPGEPAAARHTLAVFLDVVRRYDVDGVQIDDYFYPYPIEAPAAGNGGAATPMPQGRAAELDFPDEPAWQAYLATGGKLARADWRRRNIDDLVERLYAQIHREKNWLRFGISPFGLGRPERRPPGIAGFSQYDKLYADVELWLNQGWLDYLAPQLYWSIDQPSQAFGALLDYWLAENKQGRHLWPGLFTSRIENPNRAGNANGSSNAAKSFQPEEILNQIGLMRSRPAVDGHLHFSMAALMENRQGIADRLKSGPYANAALVPATTWLDAGAPPPPRIEAQGANPLKLSLRPGSGKPTALYAIWTRYADTWRFSVLPAARPEIELADDPLLGEATAVVVSAVDRLGNESSRVSSRRGAGWK